MKVIQINSVCGVGSTGRIVVDLYNMLKDKGHECIIAYGRGQSPEQIASIKISTAWDNYLHGILTRITDRHGFGSAKATKILIRYIKKQNPDIIHLHNIHGYYLNIKLLFNFLKDVNIPVIWTLHDCWSFTGHCAYYDYIGCDRWQDGCYSCPQKNLYPCSKMLDNSRGNFQKKKGLFTSVKNMTIATPSSWLAAMVKESFLGKYPVQVINNGINLDIFRPLVSTDEDIKNIKAKYGCKDKFIILGVANVWEERKGLKYLLDLSTVLDDSCCLMLVGLSQKQKSSIPNKVIGITRTDNVRQLSELYSIADVFVNPTLEDNFPTTNLEAIACGTPVITFETGGSPESIDETCGIVVEKGSAEGLLKAINTIKENPISREACLARARLFNKDDKYLEYMDLYNNLLKSNF